uniref:Uncharacterized protein n=1 Tax=Candidatus Methanogaster sp. ANME-2c ERB4 TaxID=2759911 RepID=A0A7G9YPY9_9EURY|nr:hypothetical protein NEPELPOK_00024 [Methanosarcinales archaeon ANME-2c ERB4]
MRMNIEIRRPECHRNELLPEYRKGYEMLDCEAAPKAAV